MRYAGLHGNMQKCWIKSRHDNIATRKAASSLFDFPKFDHLSKDYTTVHDTLKSSLGLAQTKHTSSIDQVAKEGDSMIESILGKNIRPIAEQSAMQTG